MTRVTKFSTLLLTLILGGQLLAQSASRTVDESFAAKREVSLYHSHGPVVILPATDGRIRLVVNVNASADRREQADEMVKRIEVDMQESADKLAVRVGFASMSSMSQNGRNITVKFDDGTKLVNITDFSLETTLYLPATDRLTLNTRFEDVRIDERVSLRDLELDLHNTKLTAGKLGGNLTANLRFGSARLGDVAGTVTGKLHDATVEIGDAGRVELESRFSEISFEDVVYFEFNGNNDEVKSRSPGPPRAWRSATASASTPLVPPATPSSEPITAPSQSNRPKSWSWKVASVLSN